MNPLQFYAPLLLPPHPQLQAIEVASRLQLPGIQIIGLPGPEVTEARERIGSALDSIGFGVLTRRIVLNLTPAALRKRGTSADLAMALACLSTLHPKMTRPLGRVLALGELGLQGEIKSCTGLPATLLLAVQNQIQWVLVPASEYSTAQSALAGICALLSPSDLPPPRVLGFSQLSEAWRWIAAGEEVGAYDARCSASAPPISTSQPSLETSNRLYRISPLQERWAGVLASGRHHALILGEKGSGKSQFLEWVAALQGELSAEEALWRWSQGLSDALSHSDAPRRAAVRRVLPEISASALLGSASHGLDRLHLGELTLAHGGALIANEFLEWKRPARECLREPLETGMVHLAALRGRVSLPARFQLLASANWCECGDSDHPDSNCRCSPHQKRSYWSRLSGPLLERLDFCVGLSMPAPRAAQATSRGDPSTNTVDWDYLQILQQRVVRTQAALRARWGCLPGEPGSGKSAEFWNRQKEGLADAEAILNPLLQEVPSSRRSRHQILRLAATLHAWDDPQSAAPWSAASIQEAALYRRQIEQWTSSH